MEHITASDIMRIREFCGKEVESRGSEICDLAIEGLRLQAINAELVALLAFAVKILDGIPAIAGTAQVDAMRAALSKAKGE